MNIAGKNLRGFFVFRSEDNSFVQNQSDTAGTTGAVRQVMDLETENVQLRKELQAQREGFDKKLKE